MEKCDILMADLLIKSQKPVQGKEAETETNRSDNHGKNGLDLQLLRRKGVIGCHEGR